MTYVVAVPSSEELREKFPKVAGELEVTPAEFMGEKWNVYTVHCEYEDGSDCPIEVDGETTQDTHPRRNPVTVFPLPLGGEESEEDS
ncbi:hypothetical protein GCM10010423_65310 [Streptomyces levis]|uniref:Uncharacterized protein n=1 Tax=Streptomyces levis TaxID=285566 RepID=A0ABP6BCX0_9ACTN